MKMRSLLMLSLLAGLPLLAAAQNCMLRDTALRGAYAGDCVRGWAHGQGRAEGKDRYEGAFMDGYAHGQGTYTFADGTRFEGLFVNGRVNGLARFHYVGGDVLEGEFRNNRLQGVGRLVKRGGETLLVELRGATLMPVPAQPPVQTAGPGTAAPGTTTAALPTAAGAPTGWEPRLDFDDLFPAYILTTATRKPAAAATRAAAGLGLATPAVQARAVSANKGLLYQGDHWGLVGVRFQNQKPGTRVTIAVTADEVAEPTQETFVLDQAGEYALYPKLRYRFDRLRQFAQPAPVNVSWSVWVDDQPRGSTTRAARLRSVNDVPFMLLTQRGPENMTWVFAGFVTEDAPWVPELVREAMAGFSVGAVGYQMGPNAVDQQVKAVYQMLQKRGVKYSSITDTAGSDTRVYSQHVRFPSESLKGAEANCVDGTVLMATLLKRMGIEPVLVTGPGHMLLGYVRDPSKPPSAETVNFVETTVVADKPFETAVELGRAKVQKWTTEAANSPMLNFVFVGRYRSDGVMPISR